MMPIVTADNYLPKLLDTPRYTGMLGRILFVALANNGRKVVVQFRSRPLDVKAFKIIYYPYA
ncbi:hypothetical protein F4859DRAFT_461990 [Xylaria cf. heliscus]|nr:hypothetical protein F4859DRAFT_461990 [Xylaria cf. heliscus]